MGLFDFIVDVSSAAVRVAITPVALVADVGVKVVTGENAGITEGVVKSIGKDLEDAADDLIP